LGGIRLLDPRHHADALVVELALEIGVQLLDVGRLGRGIAERDLHLEIVGTLVVILILVEREPADTFLADEHVGALVLLRHDADARVAEQALEISVELPDFLHIHCSRSPYPAHPSPCMKNWSMNRDGSGQPASPITLAGTPATVVLCGTGLSTTEPAAMRAQCPISMFPRILAPAPISTPRRILGWRSPASLPVPPSVTPCSMETSSSITAVSPTTRPVA